ncbi:MAG TPA: ATP-grasp domain-containing protein [Polyangiaceae bacterium]
MRCLREGMVPAVLLGDLNMLRCFARSKIPTIVANSDPRQPALHSRHAGARKVIAPFDDTERVLSDLEAIARPYAARPTLFYGNDRQLLTVSRHRERLQRSYRLRLPPPELVEKLVDKSRFGALSRELGLPVPPTLSSSEFETAEDVMDGIAGPWLVKPNVHESWTELRAEEGRGPTKALRASTAVELRRLLTGVRRHTNDFVVQAFVAGSEAQVYGYHAYLDANRNTLGHFVGRKIRTYPREAGASTYVELVEEPAVTRLGAEIVQKLGIVGPVKVDFKRDARSGTFHLLELNARYNLWHYLGGVCGVNLPLIAHAELTGQDPPPARTHRTDVRWLSFADDLRSFLRSYLPSGEVGVAAWLASLRGPKIYDVFAWNDPLPFCVGLLNHTRALRHRLRGAR